MPYIAAKGKIAGGEHAKYTAIAGFGGEILTLLGGIGNGRLVDVRGMLAFNRWRWGN